MMNKLNILWVLLLFCSCADDWKQHYEDGRGPLVISNKTVYEYLQSTDKYTEFARVLKQSRADTILQEGRRYTVWIPKNEAFPAYFASLPDSIQGVVLQNHITPVDYPVSAFKEALSLKAFSGKSLKMHANPANANEYLINGHRIVETVVACKDGVIHEVEGFIDLQPTLYEGFWEDERYSLMREVLENYMDSVFNEKLSTEIGTDFEGRPVYDSVFVKQIKVFSSARIDKDFSFYSVFLTPNEELKLEMDTYYENVRRVTGFAPDKKDTVTLNDWLVYSFIHFGLVENYGNVDQLYSTFGRLWRTSYQKIVPGSKREFSNGYLYEMADLFIPNSLIKTKELNNAIVPVYEIKPSAVSIDVTGAQVTKTTELVTPSGSTVKYFLSKIQLSSGATEDVPDYDYSVSWYTGGVEIDSTNQKVYKEVPMTPGEYQVKLTFVKSAEANQDFAVYVNDIYVNKVKMSEVTELDKLITLTLGRVNIPQSAGVAPIKVTLKNLAKSWKRALAPYSVNLERTVNNY